MMSPQFQLCLAAAWANDSCCNLSSSSSDIPLCANLSPLFSRPCFTVKVSISLLCVQKGACVVLHKVTG